MPSVTTWTRLEIGTRDADPGPGLEARVHDPLWTLGRQWQLGEFAAVDGGTPTLATLTFNQASVDRFRASTPGADPSVVAEKVGPGAPIEPFIEREHGVPDLRMRAQLGRDLVRALTAAGRAADAQRLTAAAPLASDDPAAAGLVAVLGGRVPDALTLRGTLDAEIAGADAPLKALLTAWRDRFDALVSAGAAALVADRDAGARLQRAGGGRADTRGRRRARRAAGLVGVRRRAAGLAGLPCGRHRDDAHGGAAPGPLRRDAGDALLAVRGHGGQLRPRSTSTRRTWGGCC